MGKGDYGEGDLFIGVRVPIIRKLAQEGSDLPLGEVKEFVRSKIHEERFLGLIILVEKYKRAEKRGGDRQKVSLYRFYCRHFKYINNWDLVDVSCPHVVGKFLFEQAKQRGILLEWAQSPHLWTRRIAMVSNWWLIRKGDLSMVFQVAKALLADEHDLIHKSVGWMLREAAKRDRKKVEQFLQRHHNKMPRVMLRYAIERFPERLRTKYL